LKSRSGYIAFLNRNPLFWFSKRQPLTSQSTEEAEVLAANGGVRALCWLRNIMMESGLLFAKPRFYEDNTNAILWITESKVKMRSINFDVKLALSRECHEDHMFEMVFVESHNNVADLITKVLGKELHEKYLNFIRKDLEMPDSGGVSKNESVKISGNSNPIC